MSILKRFKDLTIETLKENRKLIIICYAIFLAFFILGATLSGGVIDNFINSLPASTGDATDTGVSPIDLFIQNEGGGIVAYIFSIFFAIPAVVILAYNGFNLGMMGTLLSHYLPKGWIQYILYLIPHGIFEITSLVLQSVAGILLFLFVWNLVKGIIKSEKDGLREKALDAYESHKKIFIQSLVLMIVGTILLLIAAPIEAYVSVPLSEFILGI